MIFQLKAFDFDKIMCITIILNPLLIMLIVNLPHLHTIETNIIIITLRGLISITTSHLRKYYNDNNHVSVSQWK